MKNILITGCSSGIGWHCAHRLAEDGWCVFATARSTEDLERLSKAGFTAIHLDYTDESSITSAVAQVLAATDGKLDALFNNGAYGQPGAVEDLETNVLRAQFEANFFGWHELTRQVIPVMRAQGGGRIVNCSSVVGWIPLRWRGAYVASKFALEGLTTTMRLELLKDGIWVSLIEPGPIATKFSENARVKFFENIDLENSAHNEFYKKQIERLEKNASGNAASRFRLPPEAVYKKLKLALNSPKPKAHYGVTIPTHVMDFARKFLPQSLFDRLVISSD